MELTAKKMKYIDDAFSYHAITLGDWMLLSFQLQVITLAFHVFRHGFSRLPGFLIEIKYGENCMVCVVFLGFWHFVECVGGIKTRWF